MVDELANHGGADATVTARRTPLELEKAIGSAVRSLRLAENISVADLAERASVSGGALSNLELGKGSSVRTLTRVLAALDRANWVDELDPLANIVTPLEALARSRNQTVRRRRASRTTAQQPNRVTD